MREINFHNGAVVFSVPDAWQESHDDEHTIVLFQTDPTPMTLRLTVITTTIPAHAKDAPAQALMRLTGGSMEIVVEELSHERAFKQFTTKGGSPEHPTLIRFWHYGIRGSGLRWMQAVFSLTVDEKDRTLPAVEIITEQLDEEIRQARFDPEK
jgi:hypothetical protein